MNPRTITVPQMGEGLVEVRIVSFLKREGESVRRDDPLVEVETDKAVLVVESPVDGIVDHWDVHEGDTLPIGARIGVVSGEGEGALAPAELAVSPAHNGTHSEVNGHPEPDLSPAPTATGGGQSRNGIISPRVRAFCLQHGIDPAHADNIPRADEAGPLRTEDVERWLEAGNGPEPNEGAYRDRPLSARQKTMAQRLSRAWQQAVPASVELECNWDAIQQARSLLAGHLPNGRRPSSLNLIAWGVVRAMENHPRFRAALVGESTLREYRNVTIGIAVALPDDELTTATVVDADTFDFEAFAEALQGGIARARAGEDTIHSIQLTISKMTNEGIHYAVPVIVPPAVSTLFIGTPYDVPRRQHDDTIRWEKVIQLVLTVDHRIVNGVSAAQFLQEIKTRLENLPREFGVAE